MKGIYKLLKVVLFKMQPEKAHHFTVKMLRFTLKTPLIGKLFSKSLTVEHPSLKRTVFGLDFPNPVGLAAGFDKDGKYYKDMASLGFGFIEIGTVTPKPQIGNERPRLFRLPKDEGLINRMGFNNEGVEAMVKRLKDRPENIIIGGNIGKNKVTPNEEAVQDYVTCFEALFPYVDYFVVNVSSPNTPNLRDLQDKEPLTQLLTKLQTLNAKKESRKPILLKIAPDLSDFQLDDIIEIFYETKIDGIVATNTTISRADLATTNQEVASIGNGGLSGLPVKDRSTQVIRYLHQNSKGEIPIIGVGGINGVEAAKEKLEAGATLLQVYSSMIYYGPTLVHDINKSLIS